MEERVFLGKPRDIVALNTSWISVKRVYMYSCANKFTLSRQDLLLV